MPAEFDPYAEKYDVMLARALGTRGDVDRFAGYKIDEVADRLRSTTVRHVLDFGCGVGRGLPFLAAAFPDADLWGYDPSTECTAVARTRVQRARVTAEWSELPMGHFDCIVAANVFHHIPEGDHAAALGRCKDALADAGNLFVFEHNPLNPLTRHVFERCPFDENAAMIRRGRMVEAGRRAGMRVVRAPFTLFLPFRGHLVSRIHRALAWLPLGAQYYVQFAR